MQSFSKFLSQVSPDGLIVANADDPNLKQALELGNPESRVVGFSLSNPSLGVGKTSALWPAEAFPEDVELGPQASFGLNWHGKYLGRITLNCPGLHNIANA